MNKFCKPKADGNVSKSMFCGKAIFGLYIKLGSLLEYGNFGVEGHHENKWTYEIVHSRKAIFLFRLFSNVHSGGYLPHGLKLQVTEVAGVKKTMASGNRHLSLLSSVTW